MPARIEVGRKGYRGLKKIEPSCPGCIVVDCTVMKDTAHNKSLDFSKTIQKLKKNKVFDKLVEKVVQGVLQDRSVHVKCMMGKNRSQAVAWSAAQVLRENHPSVVFEGPVCLGNISPRF